MDIKKIIIKSMTLLKMSWKTPHKFTPHTQTPTTSNDILLPVHAFHLREFVSTCLLHTYFTAVFTVCDSKTDLTRQTFHLYCELINAYDKSNKAGVNLSGKRRGSLLGKLLTFHMLGTLLLLSVKHLNPVRRESPVVVDMMATDDFGGIAHHFYLEWRWI